MPNGSRPASAPLDGVLVVDLTRVLAGPYCTMVMRDLGARVIKVEQPGCGDDARHFGPFIDGDSAYFMSLNRGKESIALNLKEEADRGVLHGLLAKADVLVENFRPGAMERLGLGWETLHARYPRLIYAAVSGFGQSGPYRDRPAYDMVVQAMGGVMSMTGHPGSPPTRVGTSIGDITAGLFGTIGVLSALRQRESTGEGTLVDVAMLDCQVAILENAITRHATTGEVPGPMGARHPTIAPFEAYAAAEGYVVVAAGNDRLFSILCDTIGLPELATDPDFADNASRCANVEALKERIESRLATKPAREWLDALEAAGIPCGPINTVADVMRDPHVLARGMLPTMPTPGGHTMQVAGNPIKSPTFPDGSTRPPAPTLDGDRAAVLDLIKGG